MLKEARREWDAHPNKRVSVSSGVGPEKDRILWECAVDSKEPRQKVLGEDQGERI